MQWQVGIAKCAHDARDNGNFDRNNLMGNGVDTWQLE